MNSNAVSPRKKHLSQKSKYARNRLGDKIISSPHNTDAEYTRKRKQTVVGHKAFVTETCDPDNMLALFAINNTWRILIIGKNVESEQALKV